MLPGTLTHQKSYILVKLNKMMPINTLQVSLFFCDNNELTLSERTEGIKQILGKPSKTSLLKQLSQLTTSAGSHATLNLVPV